MQYQNPVMIEMMSLREIADLVSDHFQATIYGFLENLHVGRIILKTAVNGGRWWHWIWSRKITNLIPNPPKRVVMTLGEDARSLWGDIRADSG